MTKQILVVDDHIPILKLFERILSQEKDYEVCTCTSGNEAIQRICKEDFDLIISDLTLAEINGWSY